MYAFHSQPSSREQVTPLRKQTMKFIRPLQWTAMTLKCTVISLSQENPERNS